MDELAASILKTVAYYDIFDYPLTAWEIWKWLINGRRNKNKYSYWQVVDKLESDSFLGSRLESKFQYYFLRGRGENVSVRRRHYWQAEEKFQKAVRMIKMIRYFPFIKMVAVCNTLAYNNSRQLADIDLFIITSRGRVWQARFWLASFLKLFHLRPRPGHTQDTFCASFFLDESKLNIKNLAISDDIYLPYWIIQLVPVYDDGVYAKFLKANSWVKEIIPNIVPIWPSSRRRASRVRFPKKIIERVFALFPESIFEKYQRRIMPENLQKQLGKGKSVVVNNFMLKFHANDRRKLFLDKWKNSLKKNYGEIL